MRASGPSLTKLATRDDYREAFRQLQRIIRTEAHKLPSGFILDDTKSDFEGFTPSKETCSRDLRVLYIATILRVNLSKQN